jgi:hypothetical protein
MRDSERLDSSCTTRPGRSRAWPRARIAVCCAIVVLTMARASAETPQPFGYELPPKGTVIAFLQQSADWYRHTYADGRVVDPDDLVFLDDNQPIAMQIVRLSFEFAKADAAMATTAALTRNEPTTSGHTNASSSDLARFIALKNQIDTASQKETQDINTLKQKVAEARGADRRKLQAALDEAISRSELLQTGSQTINGLVDFVQSAGAENAQNGDLTSVITDLEQTVPEVANPATLLPKLRMGEAGSRATGRAHDSGIPGLASELAALKSKLHNIDDNVRLTDDLAQSVQNLRKPIAASFHQMRSGALTTLQTSDLSLLQQHKAQLDALTVEIKSMSPAIVALDKQTVLIAAYKSHLGNWRGMVVEEYRQTRNKLIGRLLIVAAILALVAAFSAASRRLLVRHIQDPNRRRLITLVHLLLTLCAIAVVAIFGFVSNLSSLATYLGLLTAGVAVALQNVIVPSLGYLVLVGKRGIKIGDRVQINGVTGDVVDMGLLQFQLKEFDVQKRQFTGNLATFANSLVFLSPATGLLKFNHVERVPDSRSTGQARMRSIECTKPRDK